MHSMVYELEWQYSDDPAPPLDTEPYIHFVFMLRFRDVPPGDGHVAHFCFNVLQQSDISVNGISAVRRGFLACVPYSKQDVMEYVETTVAESFRKNSREMALDCLNQNFIYTDADFSGKFIDDLLENDELLVLIEQAFDGVKRGGGTTRHQAIVLDDYGSEEEFLAAEKFDTESRWQDVSYTALAENPQFLCFVDPAGFRYYLPAAMTWAVRNYNKDDSDTFFTYLSVLPTIAPREIGRGMGADFDLEEFIRRHSFTIEQINAIYRFICFMAVRAEYGIDEDQWAAVRKWKKAALVE